MKHINMLKLESEWYSVEVYYNLNDPSNTIEKYLDVEMFFNFDSINSCPRDETYLKIFNAFI